MWRIYVASGRASEPRERSADAAARERACEGVRGAKPLGLMNMSACLFDELVARVAALLKQGAPQEAIDRVLEPFSSEYRAEVLAAALESAGLNRVRQP
jgi:hypothetical protein